MSWKRNNARRMSRERNEILKLVERINNVPNISASHVSAEAITDGSAVCHSYQQASDLVRLTRLLHKKGYYLSKFEPVGFTEGEFPQSEVMIMVGEKK